MSSPDAWFVLRQEEPHDHEAVHDVVRRAFGDSGNSVAAFAGRIRTSANHVPELSLVAEDDTGIVGHVMLSWVRLESAVANRILVLTPMSVRPDRQRRGIGTELIHAVLERAERFGAPAILVEGVPAYYPRFGFERASALGFTALHDGIPDEAFMVKRLPRYTPELAGRVVYPEAYDGLEE